jgi:hypothetical protein
VIGRDELPLIRVLPACKTAVRAPNAAERELIPTEEGTTKSISPAYVGAMRKLSPLFLAAILVLGATAIKAQTMKFADESFSLSSKDSDGQKIENDFLLPGETETNWTQKLVVTRFPNANDANTFANNLCLTVNTQRPGTGASVSKFGADCYVAYSTASSLGGQLEMVHRILIDPQGGVRMYVFVQRPSGSKAGSNQVTVSRDDSIHALARLSPLIRLAQ